MTTLNVFGSCNVLNCSVDKMFEEVDTNSWVRIACLDLNLDYNNFAKKSIDNNYLYNLVLTKIKSLSPEKDVILVAWCDISSKLFLSGMLDYNVQKYSIIYDDKLFEDQWARSIGSRKPEWDGTFNYNKKFGNPYYDCYFQNYFNKDIALLETWQKVSSLGAILSSLKFKYIFTSDLNLFTIGDYRELIKSNTNWFYPNNFGIVEYAKNFDIVNGPLDQHLSAVGHKKLAEVFRNYYNELRY